MDTQLPAGRRLVATVPLKGAPYHAPLQKFNGFLKKDIAP